MSNQGFDKSSGPGAGIPKQQTPFGFGFRPPSQSSSPWFNGSSLRPENPVVSPVIPLRNEFPAKTQVQDLKRTRSPPPSVPSTYKDVLQNSKTVVGSHYIPQRTKSPPHVYQRNPGQGFPPSTEPKRPSVSPPRLATRSNNDVDPKGQVWPPLYKPEPPAVNPSDVPVPKRTRLPFPKSTDPTDDDSEREMQAKAKRLARFRDELSQPESNDHGNKNQKAQLLGMEKRKIPGEYLDTKRNDNSNVQLQPDGGEDQDSLSTVIVGYCPDMCPEQERAERERKGDLDQYERLDGDRNQTTGSLAVKKYTRTAEREAALIRPMPILQNTMKYLLNLLNQPYDERLLGLYNFLWDRMRAIRMDLRMQHIFNLGAITMLEQMIRLHIVAMHELCQYTKGEGFSEGFDAHLNIEQMNKTSVELFQLYDDHRKKGIEVSTEKEFRGYYALLKLDKHPGYKVEPSELSLDLAKMTPGIRQTPQVLFARNVARACRSGNYIAFFRLVREASYLEACLMHAHFGKLRTQALASLHSGLQNNQGIPVTQVAKWLAMEEENMEELLEYHGFSIKEFDEPYMVKDGQFLNGDSEYPLKRSKLVHLKRSTMIVDDVLSSVMESSPLEVSKRVQVHIPSINKSPPPVVFKETQNFVKAVDKKMADFQRPVSLVKVNVVDRLTEDRHVTTPSPRDLFKPNNFIGLPKVVEKPNFDARFRNSLEKKNIESNVFATPPPLQPAPPQLPLPPQVMPRKDVVETFPDLPMDDSLVEKSTVVNPPVLEENVEPEEEAEPENVIEEVENEIDTSLDKEVAEAKLKLIFRLWRRRASIKKELREKKQMEATAALSSLSLGPPMRHYEEQMKVSVNFNIEQAMFARFEKQEQLWSTLNVSEVVASTLGQRNHYPRCICWKLLFCPSDSNKETPHFDPISWLQHKLMPQNINNDDLISSFPTLSIWKKLEYEKSSENWSCYLSVVKKIRFNDNSLEEYISGASGVMFISSESISWESQKNHLRKIISSIPHESRLPLLIFTSSEKSTVVNNLGLNEVNKSKIGSFLVNSFYSDEDLRNGLKWLASESPLQPTVHRVKTHELVLKHLKSSTLKLDAIKSTPQLCVSAINNAVDESIKEIENAAKSNPIDWPCSEISSLNESEFKFFERYLPLIGWSSSTQISNLVNALKKCKLPTISNFVFSYGSIENQKLELESFLVRYLSPLTGLSLAKKEASTLIQSCVGLNLRGLTYSLVPNWVMIFRRIFNWQLSSLSNNVVSTAYVSNASYSALESLEDEELCKLNSPSLDEMIQVSGLELGNEDSKVVVYDSNPPETGMELEMGVGEDEVMEEEIMNNLENEKKENERSLSRLLEQCNIVQNLIDKKLSVYF